MSVIGQPIPFLRQIPDRYTPVQSSFKPYFLAVLIFLCCATNVYGHGFIYTLEDGTAVFQLEFPDGWQLDLEFDPAREDADAVQPPRVVEATPTDGSKLWLGTWVVTEIDEIIKARTYFESLESFVFKDVMIERSRSEQHNNMPALILSGRAKKGSEAVQWDMVFFQPQENIVAAFLLIGVPEVRSRRKRELQAMIQSLRPVP